MYCSAGLCGHGSFTSSGSEGVNGNSVEEGYYPAAGG